ncbi:MAG TPA: hypothetical protein VNQ79_04930 [Blastocatellia bacterium]|nr:hypothetical protein [Blastocatellia bacterium]
MFTLWLTVNIRAEPSYLHGRNNQTSDHHRGGIGGLCTAIALRRSGIEAIVYERAEEFGAVGAGLR